MAKEPEAIDDDSKDCLKRVRQGKPHKFVMICKGVRILKLVLFKKGPTQSAVMAAKSEGFTGKPFWGVAVGNGKEVKFQLPAADGFDAPPGREIILKDFLKTEADFSCVPIYEVVEELDEVTEDDAEGSGTEQPSDTAGAPTQDTTAEDERRKLSTEFAKLSPLIPEFVRGFPDRRLEILKPTKVVKDYLDASDAANTDDARQALDAIRQRLRELANARRSPSTTAPDIPVAPPQPGKTSPPVVAPELRDRVLRAGDRVKKLTRPEDAPELFRQAAALMKKGEAEALAEALDTLESRLTSLERAAQVEQEIVGATGKGNVKYRALKMDWARARQSARRELDRIVDIIVSHPAVLFDPRKDEILRCTLAQVDAFPKFDDRLEKLLDAADKTEDPETAKGLRENALTVVGEYLKDVEGLKVLAALDDSYFGKAEIHSELKRALTGLRESLSAKI